MNSLSPLQLEQYLSIADKVLDHVFSSSETETPLLGKLSAPVTDPKNAARSIASTLSRKAYRRPASEAEVDVLVDVFELGIENNLAYRQAVRLMVKAILVSPQSLFITPVEDVISDDSIVPLDDHQLASRLSYLIWATMPDDELMSLADSGTLHEPETLSSQTHHHNNKEKVEKVAKITEFNISQFAYMVKKMHNLREGDGTLLDNCIMMWGSDLEDGNNHKRENLPFIIAGKGGGSINTGRFLPDTKGNQGDLLTSLLECAGVPLDRPVGIATKQIDAISSRV